MYLSQIKKSIEQMAQQESINTRGVPLNEYELIHFHNLCDEKLERVAEHALINSRQIIRKFLKTDL